jgi:hypothetical protein
MPDSIAEIVQAEVEKALSRVLPKLQRACAEAHAARAPATAPARAKRGGSRRGTSRQEMTRWVADRSARRVPTFVIEATGLDTKKKIVARFGANAAFEKGKPLPKVAYTAASRARPKEAARVVRAKPPIVRKAAATR